MKCSVSPYRPSPRGMHLSLLPPRIWWLPSTASRLWHRFVISPTPPPPSNKHSRIRECGRADHTSVGINCAWSYLSIVYGFERCKGGLLGVGVVKELMGKKLVHTESTRCNNILTARLETISKYGSMFLRSESVLNNPFFIFLGKTAIVLSNVRIQNISEYEIFCYCSAE